jgi:hypothetical protein
MFAADKPPPPRVVYQRHIMAAETGGSQPSDRGSNPRSAACPKKAIFPWI